MPSSSSFTGTRSILDVYRNNTNFVASVTKDYLMLLSSNTANNFGAIKLSGLLDNVDVDDILTEYNNNKGLEVLL